MAYIIDETYFQRELLVPNTNELNTGAYDELMQFIDEKSRLCLRNALGYNLFKELDSYIVNGNLQSTAPEKWLNLVNGTEYDDKEWKGLIVEEGAFKKSLLANYTFYYWLEFNQSRMSGVGEVVMNAKNAVNINPTQRLVKIWNDFVDMYQGSERCYTPSVYYKRGVRVVDWLGSENDRDYVSLIQFLSDNSEDYPEASMKTYSKINQLGI